MGQSSNDVFPSAVHLAALDRDRQRPAARPRDAGTLARGEGRRVRRRDQVGPHALDGCRPVTLGQEFAGYAAQVRQGIAAGAGRAAAARPDPARRHRRRHGDEHPPRVRREGARPAPRRDEPPDLARPPTRSRRRQRATGSSRLSGALKVVAGQLHEDRERPPLDRLRPARRVSPRSSCRSCRRARRSCPARSTR